MSYNRYDKVHNNVDTTIFYKLVKEIYDLYKIQLNEKTKNFLFQFNSLSYIINNYNESNKAIYYEIRYEELLIYKKILQQLNDYNLVPKNTSEAEIK